MRVFGNTATPDYCEYDIDEDCDVDGLDFAAFTAGPMTTASLKHFAAEFGNNEHHKMDD